MIAEDTQAILDERLMLETAIKQLPSMQQTIIRLSFVEQQSLKEIAHNLKITEKQARYQRQLALQTLREILQTP